MREGDLLGADSGQQATGNASPSQRMEGPPPLQCREAPLICPSTLFTWREVGFLLARAKSTTTALPNLKLGLARRGNASLHDARVKDDLS